MKVIVFLSSLLQLFAICRVVGCGSCVESGNIKVTHNGAMIKVKALCNNHHETEWESSPCVGTGRKSIAIINILLAAYCLLNGLHVKQMLEFFGHLRLFCFGKSFYYNLQRSVMERVVWFSWLINQKSEIENSRAFKNEGYKLNAAGDGQYDSPGFTAGFCTYTVQDLRSNAIIGLYVAQKYQVKSSADMEPFACKTILMHLAWDHDLAVDTFTTDRSTTIKSMIEDLDQSLPDGHPKIEHRYDPWHFIKNILKDLWKACKLKTCKDLVPWIPSITNMLWWSFATSIDNHDLLKEKIESIPEHITNNHSFHKNKEHKACQHPPITGKRKKKWLKKGALPVEKVDNALHGFDNSRLKDLPHMVGFTHTGSIESWNALHNHYCSKMYSWSSSAMFTRAALAAIDYNCNLDRSLARNKDGSLQFDQVCNRNGNKWFVKTRKEKKDVSFRDVIAKQILEVQINGKIMNSIVGEFFQCVEERKRPPVKIPVADSDQFVRHRLEKPDKAEAFSKHQTRMAKSSN